MQTKKEAKTIHNSYPSSYEKHCIMGRSAALVSGSDSQTNYISIMFQSSSAENHVVNVYQYVDVSD